MTISPSQSVPGIQPWLEQLQRDGIRRDWQAGEIATLFDLPFLDLLLLAQLVHRQHFAPNVVQVSTLLSIKTGNCPEDCGYCSQSVHHDTGLTPEKKLALDQVLEAAQTARKQGATRFCMGAAWRNLQDRDLPYVTDLIQQVRGMGLETCMTLGMLTPRQAQALSAAGLDYYNHNLDTSRSFYPQVIHTRQFDDRLETLAHVRAAGIKVCSGGIVGLGETRQDRVGLLLELATLPQHPESVPINLLVPVAGTPLADTPRLNVLEWIRTIAVARIVMPHSVIRLSAGRESLSDAEQALAFMAGASSLFYGDRLLTTPNAEQSQDMALLASLGLTPVVPTTIAQDEEAETTNLKPFSALPPTVDAAG